MREVPVEIAEDNLMGHARITFREVVRQPHPFRLLIFRKSVDAPPYLGRDGNWQAGPAALDVKLVSQADGSTVLVAGPEICNRIPYNQPVQLQIEGTDVVGSAFWPDITPVNIGNFSSKIELPPGAERMAAPAPPSLTEPAKRELAEPIPPPVEPLPEIPVSTPLPVNPAVGESERKSVTPLPVVPTSKPRRSPRWLYVMLAALVLIGVPVSYYERDDIRRLVSPLASETLAQKFERLKQTDKTGDQLLQLSNEAFQQNDKDIGMQAIDFAIEERKNKAAKLQEAKWYDPRTFAGNRVSTADAIKAARAYFELGAEGNQEANTLLSTLCAESTRPNSAYAASLRDLGSTFYCEVQ